MSISMAPAPDDDDAFDLLCSLNIALAFVFAIYPGDDNKQEERKRRQDKRRREGK